MRNKMIAWLLILVLLLGLTACGKDEPVSGEQPDQQKTDSSETVLEAPKFVYKASFQPLTTHEGKEIRYVNQFCVSGNDVFYVGNYVTGMETATDPVTGEAILDPATGEPMTYEASAEGIFRMDLETQTTMLLEGYTPAEIPEGMEGSSYINGLFPGNDGTIWLQEQTYTFFYDLPENFDPETDEYWNYYQEGENLNSLCQYSRDGEKLKEISLNLGEDVHISQVFLDSKDNIYATDYNQIYLLDAAGTLLATLTTDDGWAELVKISADQIGVVKYNEEGKNFLLQIDPVSKDFGEEIPIFGHGYNTMPGFGEYQYLYRDSDNVYGVSEGAETGEKLFSWLDCDVDSNNVEQFSVLENGSVIALERDWSTGNGTCNLILMEQTDPTTLPQKQELVLGCMYLDYNLRPLIVRFNRNNSDVRIVVRDYSELAQDGAYEDAIQRLNTEIISGAGPDIIAVDNVPLDQYAAKSVFVDLWPLIDADPDFGREDLMTHLFDAMSIDGKLYHAVSTFSMQTAAVRSTIAQGRTSWTLDEVLEELENLSPDAAIFGETDTKSQMLTQILSYNVDNFIDWTTGQCSFDSEEFISMLEFANTFPKEFEYSEDYWMNAESEYSRLMNGKQLMTAAYIGSFDELQVQAGLHGGDVTFIGFPSENGQGSCFMASGGLAIASDCENVDAAWRFVRELLLEENQVSEHMYQFPTNRHAFETYAEQAMTPQYEIDPETGLPAIDPETGEKIEMSTGGIGYGDDFMIDLYSMKQEEYDAFMALYESCSNVYSYNDQIMQIILEEAEAFFAGQKTAEEVAGLIQNRLGLYVAEQI